MKHDRAEFTKEYAQVLIVAGTVDRKDIDEAYFGALFEEPVRENLHAIRDFIRRKIADDVPLTWFGGEPLWSIQQARRLQDHCVHLANGVVSDGVKIISLPTAEELGLSESQMKRLIRDCSYESFMVMAACGLNISDLTVKDIDRAEFKITKKPDGVFDVQPAISFFRGETSLNFDHIVVQYDHGIVPDYEGPEGGQGSDSPAQ